MKTILSLLRSVCFLAVSLPLAAEQPNIIVLFADDLGYGDLGCYGAQGYETPHLDSMAEEGVRFTSFYVAAAGCAPSRAALLTGCYPPRVSGTSLGSPASRNGLHPDETTLAEMLKAVGYRTACVGKWHQGWSHEFLPLQQGFDSYYGLPYSHDMSRFHATRPEAYPALPLMRGNEVLELDPDPVRLTPEYTEEAVRFIRQSADQPFFLYLCYSMPHVPLYASEAFRGKSERGLFGDVVSEIDWSVGEISKALKESGSYDNTLVVFTSDNGPWLSYGDHGGSAGPLREGKGTTFEGGMRVPCLMRWPARIPRDGVSDALVGSIDFMPTFASVSGGQVPSDRVIDGKNIVSLMEGRPGARSPHEAFFFYAGTELQAVRSGPWKLHFPHKYRAGEGKRPSHGIPVPYVYPEISLSLYHLENDIGESRNLASEYPEVVERLKLMAAQMGSDIGDSRVGLKGRNNRPIGRMSQESFDNRAW